MKLSKLYIIAAAFLLVGIIVFTVGFAMLGFDFSNFDTEPVYTPIKHTADSSITSIVIKDDGADIRFIESSDKKIHIKYYENTIRTYEISENDGILSIELKTNPSWTQKLNLSRSTPVVTVMLPKKWSGDVLAESQKGDIEFDSIKAKNITANGTAGDVKLIGCTITGNLTASAKSGNLELYNNTVSGAARLSAFKGNLLAQLISVKDLYADATRGYITLADVSATQNIFGECTSGDIRLSSLIAKQSITLISANGSIRGSLKGSADDYSYNCSAQDGSCNLPESQLGGKINLNLRTSKGDIEVHVTEEE